MYRSLLILLLLVVLCILFMASCSNSMYTEPPEPTHQAYPSISFDNVTSVSVTNGNTGETFKVHDPITLDKILGSISQIAEHTGIYSDQSLNGYLYSLILQDNNGNSVQTVSIIDSHLIQIGDVLLSADLTELLAYLETQ